MQEIKFYPSMVKPLRTRLKMSQESYAYIVKCGVRSISHYETGKRATINRAVRDNMIRLMTKNGLTTDDLVPPPADTSDSDAFIDMLTEDLTGGES